MQSRYLTNLLKKSKDGKVVYRPKIYPKIELKETDLYVAVELGDRLDTLANQFYGDPSLWWIIAAANNIHNAVFTFEDGTVLRIPTDYINILRDFTED